MKIRWNPIVKKDLQVTARSMRFSWGVFAYEGVLMLAFLLALAIIQGNVRSFYSNGNIYNYLIYLFPVLAVSQVLIVALIMPIMTASAISGEKERQTFVGSRAEDRGSENGRGARDGNQKAYAFGKVTGRLYVESRCYRSRRRRNRMSSRRNVQGKTYKRFYRDRHHFGKNQTALHQDTRGRLGQSRDVPV